MEAVVFTDTRYRPVIRRGVCSGHPYLLTTLSCSLLSRHRAPKRRTLYVRAYGEVAFVHRFVFSAGVLFLVHRTITASYKSSPL